MHNAHVLIEIELCSEESEGSVLSANLKGGSSFGSSLFSTRNRFVFDTVCSVHCNFKVQTGMISWLQDLFDQLDHGCWSYYVKTCFSRLNLLIKLS